MKLRGRLIPLKDLEELKRKIKTLSGSYWYYCEMSDKICYGKGIPQELGYKGRIFGEELELRWESDKAWQLIEDREGQFELPYDNDKISEIRLFLETDWRRFPGVFRDWKRIRARKYLKDGLIQLLRFMEVEEDEKGKR